eukprot:CAMPEP_0174958234 /NCGR_PEP_ID=MMETSP0004_2-20121128/2511_1 /TAXON_ID=420556 /ORGANISM="Ochromonas sp., Strain CCMP1393" /LENGTH=321 /DNA_ID=CAMNT_0016206425 /DNA_START=615 /DNA_END=1580 /DNA_ORIENTATION=-
MALNMVNDMPDSVFLFGGEFPLLPWMFPFPHIGEAGSMVDTAHGTSTIVWPWEQEFYKELSVYDEIRRRYGSKFNADNMRKATSTKEWKDKTNKAAFYTSYDKIRWGLMEQASRHPDLFEYAMSEPLFTTCWSPHCTREGWTPSQLYGMSQAERNKSSLLAGASLGPYVHKPPAHYKPGHFKYVIVPPGMMGLSTSGRLLSVLGHCECVVLLQAINLQYHITARLQPWVHYVPLSSSGADVAAKVRWLQEHDDLAQQIAQNGYNFGLSYLRLEDYLCYTANVLEAFATVMQGTGSTALQPAKPILLQHLPWQEADQQSAKH